MFIEYNYTFGLPRNIVWKYLRDKEILRKSLPGCKSFKEISKNAYKAEMEISVGPFSDVLVLEILLGKEKPASSFQLKIKGEGSIGEIDGTATIVIEEFRGATEVFCSAEAQVTGAMAIVGQRVLASAAPKSLETFFQTVEKETKRVLYQLKRASR